MIISKYTKQKMDLVEKNLPDLYETLKLHFPFAFKMGSDPGFKEYVNVTAGLIIEYVLKSGGTDEIFQDEDLEKFTTQDEIEDFV